MDDPKDIFVLKSRIQLYVKSQTMSLTMTRGCRDSRACSCLKTLWCVLYDILRIYVEFLN